MACMIGARPSRGVRRSVTESPGLCLSEFHGDSGEQLVGHGKGAISKTVEMLPKDCRVVIVRRLRFVCLR